MKYIFIICCGLLFTLLLLSTINFSVSAQGGINWSPDEHVPVFLDDTFTPYLVADQNRGVHAFTSQWVGNEDKQLAVVYSQWSLDKGWTTPVDILLAPDGAAQVLGAFLDQKGMIHIIFGGGEGQAASIYYSKAPVLNAGQSLAWSTPILVGRGLNVPFSAALSGDDEGNLVIIYSGNSAGNGVYEIHSSNAGDSWSNPDQIYLTNNSGLTPYSLHLVSNRTGMLHAVWNLVTPTGTDNSVLYARLDITHQQWSDPYIIEERIDSVDFFGPSFPVIVDTGDELVVMYNSGNTTTGGLVDAGRPVQRVSVSRDNGQTWSIPVNPFPRHLGRSGEHSLVVDSNNAVHAVFMQRVELSADGREIVIDGPWHSEYRGGQWSEPDRFSTTWSPHDMRAVISQGNILLVTWRIDPGVGQEGVWYSYTTLDAPELPPVPIPTTTVKSLTAPQPTATQILVSPTTLPESVMTNQNGVTFENQNDPTGSVFLAVIPVILLLVGILVFRQFSRFRRG